MQERIVEVLLRQVPLGIDSVTRKSDVVSQGFLILRVSTPCLSSVQVPKVCTVEKVVEVPQVQIQEAELVVAICS